MNTDPNPDADLIALSAEYITLHSEYERLSPIIQGDDEAASDVAYAHAEVIWNRRDKIEDLLIAMPARTQEGIRCKAAVARISHWTGVKVNIGQSFDEQADPRQKLIMALLDDVVGAGYPSH